MMKWHAFFQRVSLREGYGFLPDLEILEKKYFQCFPSGELGFQDTKKNKTFLKSVYHAGSKMAIKFYLTFHLTG